MNFLHEITRKPWLPPPAGSTINAHEGVAFALPTVTIGLRIFLCVITVLFSLLIISYADRMSLPDWRSFRDPGLLWANTVLLIASSAGLEWARVRARAGQIRNVKVGLVVGSAFAYAFLIGQLLAWQQLVQAGYFAGSNPAVSFFYLVTALHGLHLLGGLVALGRASNKVWRGGGPEATLSVELCAVYWHYLFVLWLVLFGLLLFT